MNRSTQFTNSVLLLNLLGYHAVCVHEYEKLNTWVWSYDLKHEETYPSSYTQNHVETMMTPNLYDIKNFDMIRQVLNHGRDHYPVFEVHLQREALKILLSNTSLIRTLNILVKHIEKELAHSTPQIKQEV